MFYPMSAIVTLFCNILYRPLDTQARADVGLLESGSQLLKEMRLRRAGYDEVSCMSIVDGFVSELARLANLAIEKAQESRL